MNLLFGLVIGLFSASAFWITCWLIPERVWALLPEEIQAWKDVVIRFFTSVILVVICWNSVMTYAPRLTLSTSHQPSAPEYKNIPETKDIFESQDRSNRFSDRLKVEKVE
jgi:hypothetical protein